MGREKDGATPKRQRLLEVFDSGYVHFGNDLLSRAGRQREQLEIVVDAVAEDTANDKLFADPAEEGSPARRRTKNPDDICSGALARAPRKSPRQIADHDGRQSAQRPWKLRDDRSRPGVNSIHHLPASQPVIEIALRSAAEAATL